MLQGGLDVLQDQADRLVSLVVDLPLLCARSDRAITLLWRFTVPGKDSVDGSPVPDQIGGALLQVSAKDLLMLWVHYQARCLQLHSRFLSLLLFHSIYLIISEVEAAA